MRWSREASEKNPELKFYEAEILAAKAGRKTAGTFANPEVSGGVGQKRVTGSGLSAEGVAWSASVVQPFEWPGRIGLRKAIANRDIELAGVLLCTIQTRAGRARADAGLRTVRRAQRRQRRASCRTLQGAARSPGERDPAGLTPLLETRVIEATELNAQRRASEPTLATQSALLELNQLRGVSTHTRLAVGQSRTPAFRPVGGRGESRRSCPHQQLRGALARRRTRATRLPG